MQKLAVVYFPNINLDELNNFRQKYDPKWNVIKPHVTVVFPISDITEELLLQHINKITRRIKSFPINLSGLTKSFDDYLFLQIQHGSDEIVSLHDKLYSGILIPYLQKDIPFTPHITLGYFRAENNDFKKDSYEKAYLEGRGMDINLNCNFDNITLIKGDGLSPVKVIKTFNLSS